MVLPASMLYFISHRIFYGKPRCLPLIWLSLIPIIIDSVFGIHGVSWLFSPLNEVLEELSDIIIPQSFNLGPEKMTFYNPIIVRSLQLQSVISLYRRLTSLYLTALLIMVIAGKKFKTRAKCLSVSFLGICFMMIFFNIYGINLRMWEVFLSFGLLLPPLFITNAIEKGFMSSKRKIRLALLVIVAVTNVAIGSFGVFHNFSAVMPNVLTDKDFIIFSALSDLLIRDNASCPTLLGDPRINNIFIYRGIFRSREFMINCHVRETIYTDPFNKEYFFIYSPTLLVHAVNYQRLELAQEFIKLHIMLEDNGSKLFDDGDEIFIYGNLTM